MSTNLDNGVMRRVVDVRGKVGFNGESIPVTLECGHRTVVRGDIPGAPNPLIVGQTNIMCLKCRPPENDATGFYGKSIPDMMADANRRFMDTLDKRIFCPQCPRCGSANKTQSPGEPWCCARCGHAWPAQDGMPGCPQCGAPSGAVNDTVNPGYYTCFDCAAYWPIKEAEDAS